MSQKFKDILCLLALLLCWSSKIYSVPLLFDGRCMIKALWRQSISTLDKTFIDETREIVSLSAQRLSLVECKRVVHQCKIVHSYMIRFFLNPEISEYLLYFNDFYLGRETIKGQSLLDYWKSRNFVPLLDFYSFYFNCASRLFIAAIHDVHAVRSQSLDYAELYAQAERFYGDITSIMNVFDCTHYQERYVRHASRYRDLLDFVLHVDNCHA